MSNQNRGRDERRLKSRMDYRAQARQTVTAAVQRIYTFVRKCIITREIGDAVERWLSAWRSNLTPTPPIVERKPDYTPSPLVLDMLRLVKSRTVYFDGQRSGHYWSDRFMQGLIVIGGAGLSEAITRKLVHVADGVFQLTERGTEYLPSKRVLMIERDIRHTPPTTRQVAGAALTASLRARGAIA